MAVSCFTFDPRRVREFIDFGFDPYRGDTNWIPPFRSDLHSQLLPEFRFYSRRGNSHRHFLVSSGGKIVGRVSGMVNRDLRMSDGSQIGTLGFFECVEDYRIAEELLEASTGWLRKDNGITTIWGPMNFDIWHGYRFMTRGFDRPLFPGEPYNKAWYPDFFRQFGFSEKQRWVSIEIDGRDQLQECIARGAVRFRELAEKGYVFRKLDTRHLGSEVRTLKAVLDASFGRFLGFTSLPDDEFAKLFENLRPAMDPDLFAFIDDENKTLAGFVGAYVDLAEAIRSMRGSRSPASLARFLLNRKRHNRFVLYIGGMTPAEAQRRSGLGRAGNFYVIHKALEKGYTSAVIALMARGNPVLGLFGSRAAHAQREYTLYELRT